MSMLYNELIYRMVAEAQRGGQEAQFANIDTQGIAEAMCPSIFQAVSEQCAAEENKRTLLMRAKTVTFTAGSATLSSDVLKEFLNESKFFDPNGLTKEYTWVRNFSDFTNQRLGTQDLLLGAYCNQYGDVLVVREPGVVYAPGSGSSLTYTLNIPCTIPIPATATSPVDCIDEVLNDLIDVGADMLRGSVLQTRPQVS